MNSPENHGDRSPDKNIIEWWILQHNILYSNSCLQSSKTKTKLIYLQQWSRVLWCWLDLHGIRLLHCLGTDQTSFQDICKLLGFVTRQNHLWNSNKLLKSCFFFFKLQSGKLAWVSGYKQFKIQKLVAHSYCSIISNFNRL